VVKLLAAILGRTTREVEDDIAKRYELASDDARPMDPSIVEVYHAELVAGAGQAAPLLAQLRARGVSDEAVRRHRLGVAKGRVTIPVYDEHGNVVNIRYYSPGAPGHLKMRNAKGRGVPRLYLPEQTQRYDKVVVCGGELKAIVMADLLNRRGVGAVAVTAGEGTWEPRFSEALAGKAVWVCMDVDAAGQNAADKVCGALYHHVRWLGLVQLPLDTAKHPKGDVNDWVGQEGATADDLAKLLKGTPRWEPKHVTQARLEEPVEVHLSQATRAENAGRRVRVVAVPASVWEPPYVIPEQVEARCDFSQPNCGVCPVYFMPRGEVKRPVMRVGSELAANLEMINAPKRQQRESLMSALGIPPCKVVELLPLSYRNVEEVQLVPMLEITEQRADRVSVPAACVAHGIQLNEPYMMEGRMWPDPRTQRSTLLLSSCTRTHDALDADRVGDDALKLFCPRDQRDADAVRDKLDQLYSDLEANVTRIVQRRDLHMTMDLAWHSPLLVTADGRAEKGWIEVLVLGDSAQGKSETAKRLMQHYRLGEKLECKNATVAGLLGGCLQVGSRWMVSWGFIPTHDRRLVVLEELKGASVEVISKLTDMRSSGVAEIPKIEKRRTHARTRIIALSNPRGSSPIGSYAHGVAAVLELMGSPEDVRRFDVACVLAAGEVDPTRMLAPPVEHLHTSTLCRELILWAWTRKAADVDLTPLSDALHKAAAGLCERYDGDAIPLVDRGSMRLKLAKLAASLACRLYSTDDGRRVVVTEAHLQTAIDLLERLYASRGCGYLAYSELQRQRHQVRDPPEVKRRIAATPFAADLVDRMLHSSYLDVQDVQDWCGWERGSAQELLSFLVRKRALLREDRRYVKTPGFVELLREIDLVKICRPGYIDEKDEF
jgi:hypothetical protein